MINKDEIDSLRAGVEAANADLHRRVGVLCTLFAGLEMQLRDCVTLIENAGNVSKTDVLPPDEQFGRTVTRFERLLTHLLSGNAKQSALLLIPKLRDLGRMRNDIVHSSWNVTYGKLYHQERVRPKGADPQAADHPNALALIDSAIEESETLIFDLECLRVEHLK